MRITHTVGIAVLFGIAMTWWLAGSEGETNQMPVSGASSDLDASPQLSGNVVSPHQEASRLPGIPAEGSAAGRDVGADNPLAASAGNDTPSTPEAAQLALPATTEGFPGQPADTKPSQPSAIDKTDCVAAAKTLEASAAIFDVTPMLAVAYARGQSNPNASTSGFDQLRARLLAPLCSGTYAFNREDYAATMQFVAISTDSHARILVGDTWISDGTVVTPLSENDQAFFSNPAIQTRRQQGIGPGRNMSREVFERRLAQNPRTLIGGP